MKLLMSSKWIIILLLVQGLRFLLFGGNFWELGVDFPG